MTDLDTPNPNEVRDKNNRLEIHKVLLHSTKRFDFSLLIGLFSAFSLIFIALLIGGSIVAFYNIPAVCIVIFGTISVTMIAFSLREMKSTITEAIRVFCPKNHSKEIASEQILHLATLSKDRGILALDELHSDLKKEPFLQRAIALVVDGNESSLVERVLMNEISSIAESRQQSVNVLRKAAEVAPAMGLIGTLVGLIQLLGNLDNPSEIGPAMAVALLTTFYGAILAYMVFAPVAAKLESNIHQQLMTYEIYMTGALSISKQENIHFLKTYLNTKLAPGIYQH
jgi:chemotaxis protein MotA